MTDDRRSRLGWLLVVAAFWAAQLTYAVLPFDVLPDFVPLIGWADDLAAFLAALGVTGWSVWRALPALREERPALRGETLVHPAYEPLSAEQIDRL